jgi:hypothetical protein
MFREGFRLAGLLTFTASCLGSVSHAQTAVMTSQYGNARTGANLTEKILNPSNVNARQFGRLHAVSVDGDVYAQPLYLPQVNVAGKGKRNLLFVVTEHDSVYAFDADGDFKDPLWKDSFANTKAGIDTVAGDAAGCALIAPEIGITATPVIDPVSDTIYVLARTKEKNRPVQRLHALDLITGQEKFKGPVEIQAKGFDPLLENPRAALLLAANVLYLGWASNCDYGAYHGWLMAYGSRSLKQIAAFNTSPGGSQGGIWAADAGFAADATGTVFAATGNGNFTAAAGGADYGDSLLKVELWWHRLLVRDYFTPFNQAQLAKTDSDLGSGGPVLLPDQPGPHPHLVVIGGKGNVLYVLDRDKLGRYRSDGNSNAVQEICVESEMMGAPASWQGHLFVQASYDSLKDYALKDGRFSEDPVAHTAKEISSATTPSVSSDEARNGIVWTIESRGFGRGGERRTAVLHAYDATNVADELFNSDQQGSRDAAGPSLRFTIPTVADGHVYIGASKEFDVYGLLDSVAKK